MPSARTGADLRVRRFDSINVIPFIDVMLVLLAIVLTTATFIAQGRVDIDLPKADADSAAPASEPLEVAIDRHGGYFLEGEALVLEALARRLVGGGETRPIVLRVDARTAFEHFVALVSELQGSSRERLTILTEYPAP
jgi:biopolymer transport protein ExbD